jgi:hypothetical protein
MFTFAGVSEGLFRHYPGIVDQVGVAEHSDHGWPAVGGALVTVLTTRTCNSATPRSSSPADWGCDPNRGDEPIQAEPTELMILPGRGSSRPYGRVGAVLGVEPCRQAASWLGGTPNWRRYSRLNCDGLS